MSEIYVVGGTLRDNFSLAVCRLLAQRVGLLCSNPDCRAHTSGPQTDPEKVVNIGVGAHLTAASPGGPRFDASLEQKDRRAASNGIWLCQTCAKLIDSDPKLYTLSVLVGWKSEAERQTRERIGKTSQRVSKPSSARTERELKRDHRFRDQITSAFRRNREQLMALPRDSPQYEKFSVGEFIVHKLGDTAYPNFDHSERISNWFKLEMFDFYFNGIEGILGIKYALVSEHTKSWSLLPEKRSKDSFPPGFWATKIFETGKIPWRNIRHYDHDGDEYYRCPHLYCLYSDNGMPYEGFGYYQIPHDHTYLFPLPNEGRVDMERLLDLDLAT